LTERRREIAIFYLCVSKMQHNAERNLTRRARPICRSFSKDGTTPRRNCEALVINHIRNNARLAVSVATLVSGARNAFVCLVDQMYARAQSCTLRTMLAKLLSAK
jgi:hypothetical protein